MWRHLFPGLLLAGLLACGGGGSGPPPPPSPPSRPFLLGSSQWPPSFDTAQIERMYASKRAHMDLAVYHQVEGVPWIQAGAGQPLPARVLANWRSVRAQAGQGQRFYLALTPLNVARSGLADLATEQSDHAPLPPEWAELPLNDSRVKAAFLAYCRAAIGELNPDFLAIGIECNILASLDPARWAQYLDLNHSVHAQLKQERPTLPVFVTVQYEHLQGYPSESQGKQALQQQAVREVMASSDLLAISLYPYGPWVAPEVPASYLDPLWPLAAATGRTVAIAETGFPSKPFTAFHYTFTGSPVLQDRYLSMLLDQAQAHRLAFVVNWVAVDYDKLTAQLPPEAQELATVWQYDGLWDSSDLPKPALATWDGVLAKPYRP